MEAPRLHVEMKDKVGSQNVDKSCAMPLLSIHSAQMYHDI
jgi:hypothetical protein